jgi:hypothetical protein
MSASDIALVPSDVLEFLAGQYAADVPACLWGPPGIAKSSLVRLSAARYYAECMGFTVDTLGNVRDLTGAVVPVDTYLKDVRVALLDAIDLRGLPRADLDRNTVRWLPPVFMPTDGFGVVFYDELNRGSQSSFNAVMSLVLGGRLGEYVLPPGWRQAAACNNNGPGTSTMPDALLGRFVHADGTVSVSEWCEWALDNNLDPMIIAYMQFRDQTQDPCLLAPRVKGEYGAPNPRTWEFVSKIIGLQESHTVKFARISGAIGRGHATELMAFARLWTTLPNPSAILLDPHNTAVPTDIATMYATAGSLARMCDLSNISAIFTYLDRMPREYMTFAVRSAVGRDATLCATREYTAWSVNSKR